MLTEMQCSYSRQIKCGRRHRERGALRSVENNAVDVNSRKLSGGLGGETEIPKTAVPFRQEPFEDHYTVEEDIGR